MRITASLSVLLCGLALSGCVVSSGGTAPRSDPNGSENSANSGENNTDDNSNRNGDAGHGDDGGSSGGGVLPYTLSPLGSPQVESAHVSLYFSVVDANDQPVEALAGEDFTALEDGQPIDRFESEFQVRNPTGSGVRIPTVLVLDLSRSVVEAGALDSVKETARLIIENLSEEQELALLTFAGDVTVRSEFTTDKAALHAAVDEITDADGQSTNLYGALEQSYGLWSDGFRETPTGAQLVAGLVIAISDGNDTAGISTLQDVIAARGSKRTFFVRVGEEIDSSIAEQIATVGVLDANFDDLDTRIGESLDDLRSLNRSIYIAEYCSPKRAGEHELLFTVEGNLQYVEESCRPSGTFDGSCDDPGYLACSTQACCDPEIPYYCAVSNTCWPTEEQAIAECGAAACIVCGVPEEPGASPGPAITVDFQADEFDAEQCAELLD